MWVKRTRVVCYINTGYCGGSKKEWGVECSRKYGVGETEITGKGLRERGTRGRRSKG